MPGARCMLCVCGGGGTWRGPHGPNQAGKGGEWARWFLWGGWGQRGSELPGAEHTHMPIPGPASLARPKRRTCLGPSMHVAACSSSTTMQQQAHRPWRRRHHEQQATTPRPPLEHRKQRGSSPASSRGRPQLLPGGQEAGMAWHPGLQLTARRACMHVCLRVALRRFSKATSKRARPPTGAGVNRVLGPLRHAWCQAAGQALVAPCPRSWCWRLQCVAEGRPSSRARSQPKRLAGAVRCAAICVGGVQSSKRQ